MYSNLKILIVLLMMSLGLSGCGDLLGKKVVKRELDATQFEVQCELDMDQFSLIMEKNISRQINCLGDNLNLFIKVVKTEKEGYLSRIQLERYLAEFRPDVNPEVVKALKSIFDLGHLITGEDPNYISKATIQKVISFALVFNDEAAQNFGPIFTNDSQVTYALHQHHRERVSSSNKAIIQALRTIFNPNRKGEIHRLNIVELLESFTTEDNRDTIEKAKKILFLKKVLLGGESEVITHHELEKLILKFDHLLLIALDIVRYENVILKQESILQLLKRDVNDLYEIITQGPLNDRDDELLFTVNEAIEATKLFIDTEKYDVDKFRTLIGEVKKIVMKGDPAEVRGADLKRLFAHGKSILHTGTIFHRIYDKFKAQLESPRPVEETIDFDEYRHTYPGHEKELQQFERITKKYRFMKGEFLSSYYIRGSKRNADGIFEISLWEYALALVFESYGTKTDGTVGGHSLDKAQMERLVKKFENELIELDLLTPQKAVSTANNISLLGTLFQYQSDKNGFMDVNEATEFAVSLFSSLNIAEDMHGFMKDMDCSADQFDRVDPACFKKNFWKGLCTHYRVYFPLLFQSLNTPKKCEDFENSPGSDEFLFTSIKAARTCNYYPDGDKEEIGYSEGDVMTIMLALMHAETTILRWDLNNNNYMDEEEVDRAYDIYGPALDGFLVDKNPIIKGLKKQIYQYMIKYEQVPNEEDFGSLWKFVKFLIRFNKKAPAHRKTIVSLLNVISEQNAATATGPKFNCALLRDPENIPREPIEMPLPEEDKPKQEEVDLKAALSKTAEVVYGAGMSREELKLEMEKLSDDMLAGRVIKIKHIRHRGLRNIFWAIYNDNTQMETIDSLIKEGSVVDKIGVAISIVLLN